MTSDQSRGSDSMVRNSDLERGAMLEVTAARMHLRSAIEAYERVGYGSHVTQPLRDALQSVEFSISEVAS